MISNFPCRISSMVGVLAVPKDNPHVARMDLVEKCFNYGLWKNPEIDPQTAGGAILSPPIGLWASCK